MLYEIVSNLNRRLNYVQPSDIPNKIMQARKYGTELYRSMFAFDKDILIYTQAKGTNSGYQGVKYLDSIIFDIDNPDINLIKEFVNKLEEYDLNYTKDDIRVYFSGNKGFHIQIPNIFDIKNSKTLPEDIREILQTEFKNFNFDNLYYQNALIRLPNTINKKSGLYKIFINDIYEYDNIEEIKKIAVKDNMEKPKPFRKITNKITVEVKKKNVKVEIVNTDDYIHGDKHICMQRLYNSDPQPGYRHKYLLILGSTYLLAGLPKEQVRKMMYDWISKNKEGFSDEEFEKIYNDIIKHRYAYGCDHPIKKSLCSNKCYYFGIKGENSEVETMQSLVAKLKEFSNMEYIDFGYFYSNTTFKIYPQELVILLGDTGSNKSTLMQNLVVNLPNIKILYINTEMGESLLLRRFLQIKHGLTKDDFNNLENIEHYARDLENIFTINGKISLMHLESVIIQHQPQLIVVDVLEDLFDAKRDLVQSAQNTASALKQLAIKYNLYLLAIHHINKNSSKSELTVHSGKGSSAIEQKADKVLGIKVNDDNRFRTLKSLKARDEEPFETILEFNSQTFQLTKI